MLGERARPRRSSAAAVPSARPISDSFESGGGIRSSSSSLKMRVMSSLSSGLPATTTLASHAFARVEPQVGLARLGVGSVAVETLVGEDRADVAVVRDGRPTLRRRSRARGRTSRHADKHGRTANRSRFVGRLYSTRNVPQQRPIRLGCRGFAAGPIIEGSSLGTGRKRHAGRLLLSLESGAGGNPLVAFWGLRGLLAARTNPAAVRLCPRVVPILKKHCVECHGGHRHEGDFSINTRESIRGRRRRSCRAMRPSRI